MTTESKCENCQFAPLKSPVKAHGLEFEVPVRFLSFEYTLLTQETLSLLEYMLTARGYEIEIHGDDAFCWRVE